MTDLSRGNAEALVQARLGRAPQDLYEAAVVLEAWGGMRGPDALRMGRELMSVARLRWPSPEEGHERARLPPGLLPEAFALIVTVCVLALWGPALATELGRPAVELALWIALPLALGLQWALRSRYLGSAEGFDALAAERRRLLALVLPALVVPPVLWREAGLLAALLLVICLGGMILAARGWGPRFAACMAVCGGLVFVGIPPLVLVGEAALGTAVGVYAALRGSAAPAVKPRPWRRAAGSGLVGLGLGLLFLGDPSVRWGNDVVAALALVPPAVGGIWGGLSLARMWTDIPAAVRGIGTDGDRARLVGPGLLAVAAARLLGVTLSLSLLLAVAEWLVVGRTPGPAAVAAFAFLGLAVLAVSLLDALGLGTLAVFAVAAGAAAELGSALLGASEHVAGVGMAAGAATVLVVALPRAVGLLLRPGRLLGTTLSVP